MRNIFVSTMMLTLFSVGSLFAEEKTLIDFNQYEQKLTQDPAFSGSQDASAKGAGAQSQSKTADKGFTVTAKDMNIGHWSVALNSSSKEMDNVRYSFAKAVKTKGVGGKPVRTVLGARIHFPSWNNNSYATIAPPYPFPAYAGAKPSSEENGIIHNVQQIYTISAEVYGRNYNYSLYVQLRDEAGNISKYFLGYLHYSGWKTLVWKNPSYIENIDIREVKRMPLIPDLAVPYKKLDSFLVARNAVELGGNYLFYVANVKMKYDKAVITETEDIDEESEWHILSDKMKKEAEAFSKARSSIAELKQAEMKKMAVITDTSGKSVSVEGSSSNSGSSSAPTPAPAQ